MLGVGFTLLTGTDDAVWRDAVRDAQVPITLRSIGTHDAVDPDGRWNAISGLCSTGALLVRRGLRFAPLLVGVARTSRQLGLALATRALPATMSGRVDFAAAPRGALVVTLQIAIMLCVIVPLVAITQPFITAAPGLLILATFALVLGVAFWRSARSLHGHARAGAEAIVAMLGNQMNIDRRPDAVRHAMERIDAILPGLGAPEAMQVAPGSPAIDRSLASLNLRGRTGATVLAIVREGQQVLVPRGPEMVRTGDVLAVAGSVEAVAAARAIIAGEGGEASDE